MPLDVSVVGEVGESTRRSWSNTDTMLYALGVGAGADDPREELAFTTENTSGVTPSVLPTFGVLVASGGRRRSIGTFDFARLVHAEQSLELHAPLPVAGTVEVTSRVTDILAKPKGALVRTLTEARSTEDGTLLATTRSGSYIAGESDVVSTSDDTAGPHPADVPWEVPEREPDLTWSATTTPSQALLYRLSGDHNPLHSDPAFARRGGFERPILHGLCTYGFSGRALLHGLCDSDPERFVGMYGQFRRPVLPGARLRVDIWRIDDTTSHFRTSTDEGTVVIDRGVATTAEEQPMPPRAAIAGIHEYPDRLAPGLSALQIKAISAAAALADAGLTFDDVDALYDAGETGPMSGIAVAEYLGITPRIIDTTSVGGSSYEFHAGHAMRHIATGQARVALLTYGSVAKSNQRSIGTGGRPVAATPSSSMEAPFGLNLIGNYALVARRHMHEYQTTASDLAEIAVTTRAHAVRNPAAVAGLEALGIKNTGELSIDDVLGSRLIADPLHLLECCLVSDGGGAVVIVAEDVVADTRHAPVWLLGAGEAIGYPRNGGSITRSAAVRSAPAAFGEAGVTPGEIDVAMLYDSFTITVLMLLEDLGFAPRGEAGAFAADGRLRWDRPGAPALNTDGGGLSSNHPGMRGIFLLIEAVRQLRGESTSQVPDARLAVAHGNGGLLGTRHAAGTVILGRD